MLLSVMAFMDSLGPGTAKEQRDDQPLLRDRGTKSLPLGTDPPVTEASQPHESVLQVSPVLLRAHA